MAKNEILKQLEDTLKNTQVNDAVHQKAFEEYAKLLEIENKNELENKKLNLEKRKIESTEEVEKAKLELETNKFENQKETENPHGEGTIKDRLEAEKLAWSKDQDEYHRKMEMKLAKMNRRNAVVTTVLGGTLTLTGIVVGNTFIDKQMDKSFEFEKTNCVSSFTSKSFLGGLFKPKK